MGEPVVVEERAGDDGNFEIGGGPTNGVVLYMNGPRVYGELVGPDARPIRPLQPESWAGSPTGVERCGDRWLVAWVDGGAGYVAPIDDRGVRGTPSRVVAEGVFASAFACDGDRALFVWGTYDPPRKIYAVEIVGGQSSEPVLVAEDEAMWLSARRRGEGWQLAWSVTAEARVALVEGTSATVARVGPGWRPVFAGDEVLLANRKGDDRALGPDLSDVRTVPNTFAAAQATTGRWFGAGKVETGELGAGPLEGPRTALGKFGQYPEGATIGGRPVFVWSQLGVVYGASLDPLSGKPDAAAVLSIVYPE